MGDKSLRTLRSEFLVKLHTNMASGPKRNGPHGEGETPIKSRIQTCIDEGILSIRAAARRFGVRKSTIHNWMHVGRDRRLQNEKNEVAAT